MRSGGRPPHFRQPRARARPPRAASAAPAAVLAALLLTGCAAFQPLQVDLARTGETVVRVRSTRTFDELAETVYGDPALGPRLAELAGLPYDEKVPRGALLVLPAREELDERLQVARSAEEQFRAGLDAADRGAFRQAAQHFRAALSAAPHRVDVRYNLGLALLKAGEAAEATPVLEEVARLRPDHAPSRYAFGSALRQRRAWARALGEFEAAARLDPRDAPAAYAVARTLEDRGDVEDAKRAYRAFRARFPDHALAATAEERLAALERPPAPDDTPRPDLVAP